MGLREPDIHDQWTLVDYQQIGIRGHGGDFERYCLRMKRINSTKTFWRKQAVFLYRFLPPKSIEYVSEVASAKSASILSVQFYFNVILKLYWKTLG